MAYMRLGDLLVASGTITGQQLERALALQKETKHRLGDVLIQTASSRRRSSSTLCECSWAWTLWT